MNKSRIRRVILPVMALLLAFSMITAPIAGISGIAQAKNGLFTKPDLAVTNVQARVVTGGYQVIYRVENQGTAVAAAGHYASLSIDDKAIEHQRAVVSSTTGFEKDLAPGASWTGTFKTVIECSGKSDTIQVCADALSEVAESNEKNNCMTITYTCPEPPPPLKAPVLPPTTKPDLVITNISATEIEGGYKVVCTVENTGTASAGEFNIYLTIDGVLTAANRLPGLFQGVSQSTFSPLTCSGTSDTIQLCADALSEVDESNENNNCMTTTYTCPEPPPPLKAPTTPKTPSIPPSIVYVDDNAPNDPGPGILTVSDPNEDGSVDHPFDEIQQGINVVAAGGTVNVAAGTYYENITLKDGVKLTGAGADVTTINGGGNGPVVTAIGMSSDTTLEGFTITNGYAEYGGGMYNYSDSNPTVANCIFTGNSASNGGGGMYNFSNCLPDVSNCIFANNTASSGGGMANNYSDPTVTDCTFSDNKAGNGGGMVNTESDPKVTNCGFSGNEASNDGGGMHNRSGSRPEVSNCIFANNTAESSGGGMANHSSAEISNCTFSGNSAYYGGGMVNHTASKVRNCIFSGNEANYGGGMRNTGSYAFVANCTFSGNLANYTGGGMDNSDSAPEIGNCVFFDNKADEGGGMYNNNPSIQYMITIWNCTFSGNLGNYGAGGIENNASSLLIRNCILWGDSPREIGNRSSTLDLDHIDIQGGYDGIYSIDSDVPEWVNQFGTLILYNFDYDPLFVDPANGNLRLQAGSPCIDTGTNDNPSGVYLYLIASEDIDGNPRPIDGDDHPAINTDIGAYEYSTSATVGAPSAIIEPSSQNVAPLDSSTLDIWINPAGKGISGGSITITFPADLIQVDSVEAGDLLGSSPIMPPGDPKIDNALGTVGFDLARTGATTAPTPPGYLAKITFTAKALLTGGSGPVNIINAEFLDENFAEIAVTAEGGSIEVITGDFAVEDINRDGIVDFKDFTILAAHYGETVSGPPPKWDLNRDGTVNYQDLGMIAKTLHDTAMKVIHKIG